MEQQNYALTNYSSLLIISKAQDVFFSCAIWQCNGIKRPAIPFFEKAKEGILPITDQSMQDLIFHLKKV